MSREIDGVKGDIHRYKQIEMVTYIIYKYTNTSHDINKKIILPGRGWWLLLELLLFVIAHFHFPMWLRWDIDLFPWRLFSERVCERERKLIHSISIFHFFVVDFIINKINKNIKSTIGNTFGTRFI